MARIAESVMALAVATGLMLTIRPVAGQEVAPLGTSQRMGAPPLEASDTSWRVAKAEDGGVAVVLPGRLTVMLPADLAAEIRTLAPSDDPQAVVAGLHRVLMRRGRGAPLLRAAAIRLAVERYPAAAAAIAGAFPADSRHAGRLATGTSPLLGRRRADVVPAAMTGGARRPGRDTGRFAAGGTEDGMDGGNAAPRPALAPVRSRGPVPARRFRTALGLGNDLWHRADGAGTGMAEPAPTEAASAGARRVDRTTVESAFAVPTVADAGLDDAGLPDAGLPDAGMATAGLAEPVRESLGAGARDWAPRPLLAPAIGTLASEAAPVASPSGPR